MTHKPLIWNGIQNQTAEVGPDRVIQADIALSAFVTCDVRRIGQLASNLLGNAITHGAPDKPIRFSATTSDDCFELFVANVGDPIPPAVLPRIFEPFERGTLRSSWCSCRSAATSPWSVRTASAVLSAAPEQAFWTPHNPITTPIRGDA